MTNEERQLINECRVTIVGMREFIAYVKRELEQIGFNEINVVSATAPLAFTSHAGIIIEHIGDEQPLLSEVINVPIIYAFDFIEGAGAIVVFPDGERDFLNKSDIRVWAAEYLSGYCAFWNIEDSEWLHDTLPSIIDGKMSLDAQKTAARICARIAANIAVSRDVKHYPRFYLSRNLK